MLLAPVGISKFVCYVLGFPKKVPSGCVPWLGLGHASWLRHDKVNVVYNRVLYPLPLLSSHFKLFTRPFFKSLWRLKFTEGCIALQMSINYPSYNVFL